MLLCFVLFGFRVLYYKHVNMIYNTVLCAEAARNEDGELCILSYRATSDGIL